MQRFVCLVLFILPALLGAQELQRETMASTGGSGWIASEGEKVYVSQTIGQRGVIGTYTVQDVTLRQGFQQPPLLVLAVPSESNDLLEVGIYPNPVYQDLSFV